MFVHPFQAFLIICMTVLFSSTNGLTDEEQDLLEGVHEQCTEEMGATEDQIAEARKGNFSDDPRLKCYIKCVFNELRLLYDDETIDADGLVEVLPAEYQEKSETILNTLKKCNTPKFQEVCETIWSIHKCYYAENPQNYYLP